MHTVLVSLLAEAQRGLRDSHPTNFIPHIKLHDEFFFLHLICAPTLNFNFVLLMPFAVCSLHVRNNETITVLRGACAQKTHPGCTASELFRGNVASWNENEKKAVIIKLSSDMKCHSLDTHLQLVYYHAVSMHLNTREDNV